MTDRPTGDGDDPRERTDATPGAQGDGAGEGGAEPAPVDDAEFRRRRRMRSIAIAVLLAALVVLFYVVTVVRLGSNVMNRPL